MIKNVAIYPFSPDLLPVIRHFSDIFTNYNLSEVYAPMGSSYPGLDVGITCNHTEIGILAMNSDDFIISKAETLFLIVDDCYEIEKNDDYLFFLETAKSNKMEIIIFNRNQHKYNELKEILQKEQYKFNLADYGDTLLDKERTRATLNTPVILVGGIVSEPDISELYIQLFQSLCAHGVKVSTIVKNFPLGKFLDIKLNTIYESWNDEKNKIRSIKDLILNIEHNESPDIILIEAPDALLEFNEFIDNGFGIRSLMLSQAIALDGIACTVPFELSNAEYINALNDEFVKRFGAPLLGVHKSNVVLDPLEMDQTMKVSYCHVPLNVVDEFINNTVAETAVPVINIHTENISQISKNIVCRLSS